MDMKIAKTAGLQNNFIKIINSPYTGIIIILTLFIFIIYKFYLMSILRGNSSKIIQIKNQDQYVQNVKNHLRQSKNNISTSYVYQQSISPHDLTFNSTVNQDKQDNQADLQQNIFSTPIAKCQIIVNQRKKYLQFVQSLKQNLKQKRQTQIKKQIQLNKLLPFVQVKTKKQIQNFKQTEIQNNKEKTEFFGNNKKNQIQNKNIINSFGFNTNRQIKDSNTDKLNQTNKKQKIKQQQNKNKNSIINNINKQINNKQQSIFNKLSSSNSLSYQKNPFFAQNTTQPKFPIIPSFSSIQPIKKDQTNPFKTNSNFFNTINQKPKNAQLILQQNNKLPIAQSTQDNKNIPSISLKPPSISPSIPIAQTNPPRPSSVPVPIVPVEIKNLTSEQYILNIINYCEKYNQSMDVPLNNINLIGAKTSPMQMIDQAKVALNNIDKTNQKQITKFAHKLFDLIVLKYINQSNVRAGLDRIPPKSRSDTSQKNIINRYILTINLYRMMGYQKIWVIIFGRTLKMLDFIFFRRDDIKNQFQLELVAKKIVNFAGNDFLGKYLSRIDFFTYFLLGLVSFDPILIFKHASQSQPSEKKAVQQINSWGNVWNYKQYWIVLQGIFKNKHQSYFKPIVYMNLLYTLYPRLIQNRKISTLFQQQNKLYKAIIQCSLKYLKGFKNYSQIIGLSKIQNKIFQGDQFTNNIRSVLETRFRQLNSIYNKSVIQIQKKCNIFYYFQREFQ